LGILIYIRKRYRSTGENVLFSKKAYQVVRIVFGAVFIVSGGIKIVDINSFAEVINAFAILPYGMSYPSAVLISISEILFGAGLLADIRGSLAGILSLLFLFALVLGWALYMGYDIDCGCFGPEDPEAKAFASLKTSLLRDILMIGLVSYLYASRIKNNHIPKFLPLKLLQKKETMKS